MILSCGKNTTDKNDSIIGKKFEKIKDIKKLSNYTKISDTTIYGNNSEPKHGILHLRDDVNNMIVLNRITLDSIDEDRIFEVLDTLIIPNLNKPELITIGYCQVNKDNDENLISIVDKTDSLLVQNIKKVWRANTATEKIERVADLNGINCLNEWFAQ